MVNVFFYQCTNCNRNIENKDCLWFDLEKRICRCCECMGYEREVIGCKRVKCPLHKYIDYDFITITDNEQDALISIGDGIESIDVIDTDDEIAYDEKSNTCFRCGKELFDFIYLNAKLTRIPFKDDDEQVKTKVKLKFCITCWEEVAKVSKIKI